MSQDYKLSNKRLFGRQKPIHVILGGDKVANIILWRDKSLSAKILIGVLIIWILFGIVDYNLLTLVCHISIIHMLLIFIWYKSSAFLDLPSPKIPEIIVSERAFREMALTCHAKFTRFISILYDIGCGKDLKLFFLTILSLWILSIIGSCFSSLNLLFFGLVCVLTLPALYERYEDEVEHLAMKGMKDLNNMFNRLDSDVLNKIPRGHVKDRKSK